MTPASREPLSSGRSRAALWAWVPTVLGAAVLIGSGVWGGLSALQGAETPRSGASLPMPAAPGSGMPNPQEIRPPAPKSGSAPEEPSDRAPVRLSPSANGQRVRPAEAKALLPVTESAPIWGTSDALATVAIFGDLECPYTRAALRRVIRLADRLPPTELRLVFYQRPLDEHSFATKAARMLAAASIRGGADAAFRALAAFAESDEKPNEQALGGWFESAGIRGPAASLAEDPAGLLRVREDLRLAAELDVRVTPTVFVNGRRIQGSRPALVLERVIADEARATRWLRAQGVAPEKAYAQRVEKNLIGVEGAATDRVCAPVEGAPVEGSADALVTLVEFSDFECTHCRRMEPDLRRITQRYPGLVRRVWRSFALPQHPRARRVAAFALAAREAGNDSAFWRLHGALLREEKTLDDALLRRLAGELLLPAERLLDAASDPARAGELDADEALGRELGVEGTPTLFVNGRRVTGAVPAQVLDAVVREELAAARRITREGTVAKELEQLLCDGASGP